MVSLQTVTAKEGLTHKRRCTANVALGMHYSFHDRNRCDMSSVVQVTSMDGMGWLGLVKSRPSCTAGNWYKAMLKYPIGVYSRALLGCKEPAADPFY
jgi:hypothetical protein